MSDNMKERRAPTSGEVLCTWETAGYESHAKCQCQFQDEHKGRHECEHGKDGGWKKIGSHTVG